MAIERQEADCRAWAERNDLEVCKVHIDRGRSGFKAVERAGFDAAVAAVTSGVVGTLIVWKVDRLSRRGIGQVGLVLDEVEKAGLRTQGRWIGGATPYGLRLDEVPGSTTTTSERVGSRRLLEHWPHVFVAAPPRPRSRVSRPGMAQHRRKGPLAGGPSRSLRLN